MYNSTPHTTTGKTPAELFFGRQFRDKIPSITTLQGNQYNAEVEDRDKEMKEKEKQYKENRQKVE